jgi:hypothetical protein
MSDFQSKIMLALAGFLVGTCIAIQVKLGEVSSTQDEILNNLSKVKQQCIELHK